MRVHLPTRTESMKEFSTPYRLPSPQSILAKIYGRRHHERSVLAGDYESLLGDDGAYSHLDTNHLLVVLSKPLRKSCPDESILQ